MSTLDERLTWARESAGFETAIDAAAAMGVNRYTYAQHENGTRGFKRSSAIQYARKFKVSLEWLLAGRGDPRPPKPSAENGKVLITQYVGAGAEVIAFPDQGVLGEIDWPATMPGAEAMIVRGDSMPPFGDGWKLIWQHETEGVPANCIGKLCIVDVKSGPMLVKILQRGSKRGFWNLISWDGDNRENMALNWAAPVLFIQPR